MAEVNRAAVKGILGIISLYQYWISPVLGSHCRFYPSCSQYANIVLYRFGIVKGGILFIRRLIKCHPWHEGGVDFPPPY